MTRIEDDEQSVRLLGRDPPGHTAPMNDEVARHRAPDRLTLSCYATARHEIYTIFEGTSEIQREIIARDVIGAITNAWMLYFGLLFVAVVLFRPEGVAGAITAAWQNRSLHSMRQQGGSALRLLFGGGLWR